MVLSGIEGDRPLQRLHRGAEHRLSHILGVLPGQRRVPPGGGVVGQVKRQPGEEVGELPTKQRQVDAVLQALPGIQELLHLLPVVPYLREQIGVRHGRAFQCEALDIRVKLVEGQGIDPRPLLPGGHRRITSVCQESPRVDAERGRMYHLGKQIE